MARKVDGVAARGGAPPGRAGAEPGAPAQATRGQRWLARLAFAAAFAAVVVVLLSGALKSVTALLVGFAGLAIACAAAWWFLANRGVVRWLASAVLVAAPVAVIVVYVAAGLLWEIALSVVLAAAAVAAGRAALSSGPSAAKPREVAVAPQRQPFVIMNPRSGGGKVGKFGLKDKAAALGAEVALLEGPGVVDVAALARQAVDDGADGTILPRTPAETAAPPGHGKARDQPLDIHSNGPGRVSSKSLTSKIACHPVRRTPRNWTAARPRTTAPAAHMPGRAGQVSRDRQRRPGRSRTGHQHPPVPDRRKLLHRSAVSGDGRWSPPSPPGSWSPGHPAHLGHFQSCQHRVNHHPAYEGGA